MSHLSETGPKGGNQAGPNLDESSRRLDSSGSQMPNPSNAYDRAFLAYQFSLANTLIERTAESFGEVTFDQSAIRVLELAQMKANGHHLSWVSGSYLATAIASQSPLMQELVPDIEDRIREVEDSEAFISGTRNDPAAVEFDREAQSLLERARIHAMSAVSDAGEGKTLDALLYALAESSLHSPYLHLYSRLFPDDAGKQILSRLSNQFAYPQPE